VDENGRPLRIIITSGVTNDCTKADELQEDIKAGGIVADRAYDTNSIIEKALEAGMKVVIPSKKSRKEPRDYDKEIYKTRRITSENTSPVSV
jgi:IS5 family transposase